MATVYLAEDRKHERQVAIKVLKPELAAVIGAERFVSEIKTTAALQHPHILPLFDSGETDGFLFYVMPYIDGETLRERLDRERQLPVDEAVRIAKACADALDYAHRHDVIHRDIKPANILLHEGNPVIADFGIALAISAAGGGRLTETGLSLGTPHYMSPEQASADRDLTARSDVYSLGCVLYEMLAGDPPHTGPTAQAVLMRILTEDPRPVTDQRRAVPPHVAAAVTKSLEKLPADRFESAAAFGAALADRGFTYTAPRRVATSTATIAGAGTPSSERQASWWTDIRTVVALALLVALMGALAMALREREGSAVPATVVRAAFGNSFRIAAVSHDGSMVAYVDDEGLWLRRLDEVQPRLLVAGTPAFPVFSPDDTWVAYSEQGEIRRVSVRGGSPITVNGDGSGAASFLSDWGEDGRILYSTFDGTYVMPGIGDGEARRVLEAGLLNQRSARFLPGKNAVIYTRHPLSGSSGTIHLLELDTGRDTLLIDDGLDARYVSSGHLVFGRASGTLFAVPFDLEALSLAGSAAPVLDSVGVSIELGLVNFAVSDGGIAVYSRRRFTTGTGNDRVRELVYVDERGEWRAAGLPRASGLSGPVVSRDGRFALYGQDGRTYTFDLVIGANAPLTPASGTFFGGVWRRDGSVDGLGFAPEPGIYNVMPGSGSEPSLVYERPDDISVLFPIEWTRDGRRLLMGAYTSRTSTDLYTLTVDPDTVFAPFLNSDWFEQSAALSPDDRWVAYASNQGGSVAVYVRAFPEPGPPVRVSPGSGNVPRWDPSGTRIYYRNADSIFAADVSADDAFTVEEVRLLFTGSYAEAYGVMPDGRLLMLRDVEEEGPDGETEPDPDDDPGAYVVVNWFEELRARLGESGR